ncbi:MAG TPA: Sir2 family NAD-dependent protein deacetylase [Thermoanaerobaculia bacterium]|nr:Sir2 family NAD-dependent protein deacetylase [Thermoanaerobaculia bacterium]
MKSSEPAVEGLGRLIAESRRLVAFTGAGISTESGIPDFRSPGGIWSRYRPIDFREFLSSQEARRETWRRRIGTGDTLGAARPNRGHEALAVLHRHGVLSSVITQNVDGLHQASGVPGEQVIELHGNATYATCLDCAERYEIPPLLEHFRASDEPPACSCGGWIKSATISFGQPMPEDAMRAAEAETSACDAFLVLGTSLRVYPAAGFPRLALESGARLAIVNRERTDLDARAEVVIHGEIGPALSAAVESLAS